MQCDLTDLRLFAHVVDAGSVTGGAARSHLALASASARLSALETRLGTALLVRGPRGVRPTEAGWTMLRHARLVLDQLDAMDGALSAFGDGARASVRLLANTAALSEFLPDALGRYLATHPTVRVEVEERPSAESVQVVARGDADLGIVTNAVDTTALALATRPFRRDRLVLVASPHHPLVGRRAVTFDEALDHELVGLTAPSALQSYLDGQAAQRGRRIQTRARARDFAGVCRLAARGVGLGIVSATAATRAQRTITVRRIGLTDAWAGRELTICARSFDALPAHTIALVDALSATR